MMKSRLLTLSLAAVATIVVACKSASNDSPTEPNRNLVTFRATMNGASEVPANTTTGSGVFTGTLDTVTNIFTYDITFTGLSSPVNNGHIHGPALATATSGTTINFNTLGGSTFSFGQTAGGAHGVAILSPTVLISATMTGDSLKKLLFAGLTYANIHTTNNPAGEIRGQITKQ
jgi:hypothetical protein